MKRISWPAGFLFLLSVSSETPAQVGITYKRVTRNSALTVSVRRPIGFYAGPFTPVVSPFGFVGSSTTIVVVTPPVIVPPPPQIILPPPLEELDPPPPPRREEPPEEQPLPGRDAGVFRPLDPDNRDKAKQPVPLPEPPPEERPLPPPPVRANPADEARRQIELGREAFGRGRYGQAAERFRQAVQLAPNNAVGHFLLAQAQIALGNHRPAFDALMDGLRLDPTWPKQPFEPGQLYGDNLADLSEHLGLLEELQKETPDDPLLQFVTGYLLWFDGRRQEARDLLLRAAPALPNPEIVDRFLEALPRRDLL